jgi:hypothetical protein
MATLARTVYENIAIAVVCNVMRMLLPLTITKIVASICHLAILAVIAQSPTCAAASVFDSSGFDYVPIRRYVQHAKMDCALNVFTTLRRYNVKPL